MTESREHLQTLTEIRGLMERSTKFLSLSGLSGVSAGLIALLGGLVAYVRLRPGGYMLFESVTYLRQPPLSQLQTMEFLFVDAVLVFVLALLAAWYFTSRKARRLGQTVWTSASRRLLWALVGPLLVGGIFCMGLVYHWLIWLVCPAMLTFYGLALLNTRPYTYRDLEYLGYCEIALGLIALFLPGYGLLIWTVGFGGLHILYGTLMWHKYDRPTSGRPNSDSVTE